MSLSPTSLTLPGVPDLIHGPIHGPGGAYPRWLGSGLMPHVARLLSITGLLPGPAAVVSQASIAELHAQPLIDALSQGGYQARLICVPEGEGAKCLDVVSDLYDHFAAMGHRRTSPVIALGGGVVGDVAGFAAATWLRGVPLVHIPTTLLAMVDSSIGGKTAVDLPQGKNLVGAFKEPHAIIADVCTLATLPEAARRCGMAEIIKHGVLADPSLFERLSQPGELALDVSLIAEAAAIKIAIIEDDPREAGSRRLLNLGHTFGHALEAVSGYALPHGEAVAIGLVAAARLGVELGLAEASLPEKMAACVRARGLPTTFPGGDALAIRAAMSADKKRLGRGVTVVVPRDLGACMVVVGVDEGALRVAIESIL